MIQAAVGFKCPECAKYKTHIEEITPKHYMTGGAAGIIIGAGAGYIWFNLNMYGIFISLMVAYAVGFCISKAISLSIGNKIGLKIQIFAGVITVISIVYNPIILVGYLFSGGDIVSAILWSTFSFFSIFRLIAVVIAVWAAVRHFRI